MRALVQRVLRAQVAVDGEVVGEIGPGLLTLLGVGEGDDESDVDWTVAKALNLRVFEDDAGKMNASLLDRARSGLPAGHLIVSQFTLYGDVRKGNRPSFVEAAKPEAARALYDRALTKSAELGVATAGGRFQAHMEVESVNDGPVTIWIESPSRARSVES